MTDNKQFQQVQETSWDEVKSLREINRTITDSVMTMQNHNLKFTQGLFLSWMELLTQQTESVQHLQHQWRPQIPKQQEAFQKPISTSMRIYMDFLLAPFILSRKLVEASMTATQRERELVS
jgi:hypothetical protein